MQYLANLFLYGSAFIYKNACRFLSVIQLFQNLVLHAEELANLQNMTSIQNILLAFFIFLKPLH